MILSEYSDKFTTLHPHHIERSDRLFFRPLRAIIERPSDVLLASCLHPYSNVTDRIQPHPMQHNLDKDEFAGIASRWSLIPIQIAIYRTVRRHTTMVSWPIGRLC